MKIGVVGAGYVGLVAAACFADSGNDVVCSDIDDEKISMLKKGRVPIFEPSLDDLVRRNLKEKRLKFTSDLQEVTGHADIIFIAVGTPPNEDGSADLKHVLNVAREIGQGMAGYKLIVVKSTVPVGTCDKVRSVIAANTKGDFDVASNPEFLKEGDALRDFLKPDRIICGVNGDRAKSLLSELYAPFVRTENPILFMDVRSSEMTKYASNAMLAARISFMNELANLSEVLNCDIDNVRKGMGFDPRIGKQFLFAGIGYGGSCFPKDVKALVNSAREHGMGLSILEAVEKVNQSQKEILVGKILRHYGGNIKGKKFAIWGLSFKPNTDDMREAPAIPVIEGILKKGGTVAAYDPEAMPNAKKTFKDRVSFTEDNYAALAGADALVVVTEWNEFRNPDSAKVKALMKGHVIFDGRNIFHPEKMKGLGFVYFGIGRG